MNYRLLLLVAMLITGGSVYTVNSPKADLSAPTTRCKRKITADEENKRVKHEQPMQNSTEKKLEEGKIIEKWAYFLFRQTHSAKF